MTLEEARTVWLTIIGSDWVDYKDVLESGTSTPIWQAYVSLRLNDALDKDLNTQKLRVKCY
jgi:hypothetical protein